MNTELDTLRDEQRATQILMKELMARLPSEAKPVAAPAHADRVRARFDQITHTEDLHGKGNH